MELNKSLNGVMERALANAEFVLDTTKHAPSITKMLIADGTRIFKAGRASQEDLEVMLARVAALAALSGAREK